MKKLAIAITMLTIASAGVFADTSVQTTPIDVTATVVSPNNATTVIRNVADNAVAGAMGFGSISGSPAAWTNRALQYVQINVNDNAPTWNLRAYTDNFATAPDTTTWGEDFYGALLADNNPGRKIYLGHTVSSFTVAGGPACTQPGPAASVWKVVMDARDSGFSPYTNIAVGGPDFAKIYPNNFADAGILLPASNAPMYWYVEGNFNAAAADSYTGKFKLELINL